MSNKTRLFFWGIIFFGSILFSPKEAVAAFSGSLYSAGTDEVVVSGTSVLLHAPMSGGVFPYTCNFSGTDGTDEDRIKATAQETFNFTVSPTTTTTYTLSCFDNVGATFEESATITVSSTPVITSLRGAPAGPLPAGGGMTQIYAKVYLADRCTPTGGNSLWRSFTSFTNQGNYTPTFTLTQTTTFTLECFNAQGQSSGKKSVTVYVGNSHLCGNSVKDVGEECDLGSANGNSCPAKCSLACQSNNCDSVAEITIKASPKEYDAGDSVKVTWSTKNAVSCEVRGGEGFNNPIGTSGSITVYPTRTHQNYSIECYDAGGLSKHGSAPVTLDVDYDIDIISFGATPNPIPFGYTGDISFAFKVITEPVGAEPTCSLGSQSGPGSWAVKGTPLKSTNGTITLPLSQLTTNTPTAGPGGKRMGIKCTISDGTFDGLSEYAETVIGFQSDPTKAPLVSLSVGRGSDRTLNGTVPPNTSVRVYQGIAGAERCEWTDSRTGMTSLTPFTGEKTFDTTVTETTIFKIQCWNGTLTNLAEFTVVVTGASQNPGPGQNPGTGGGPTNPGTGGGPTGPTPSMTTVSFGNIVGFSTVNDLLTRILSFLQGFIVTLAIIFIVIGGFLYITSAGNDSQMETAKKCILGAVIGLALGIAAPAFLKEVYTILGTDTTIPNGVGTTLSILQIAQNVLSFLLTIIGIIAIIMLVIGGIMYLTAAGNEDQLDRGKKIVKYSIIGIFIALASLVLVRQVAAFFS